MPGAASQLECWSDSGGRAANSLGNDPFALTEHLLDADLLDVRVLLLELVRKHEGDDRQGRDVRVDRVGRTDRLLDLLGQTRFLRTVAERDDLEVCQRCSLSVHGKEMFRQCLLTFRFLEGGGKEARVLGVVERNLAVPLKAELDHVVEQADDRGCRSRAVNNGVGALA